MNIQALQTLLQTQGRYHGRLDGQYGPLTGAAVMLALTDGPDTALVSEDYARAADAMNVQAAAVQAFAQVESAGAGFINGAPTILFEPHRFSRATKGAFDLNNPDVSYPKWDPKRYPRTQAMRYGQLIKAVGLNVDAGFSSASYGKFQILGENWSACGYRSPFDFAVGQAKDEKSQLLSFVAFCTSRKIDADLRAKDWAAAAEKYNGTAYRQNQYDLKLERAYIACGGR